MSDRIWAATRKGLFEIVRGGAGWRIAKCHFLAMNAAMMLRDSRDGALYVALKHDQFGSKLHRSRDGGAKWEEAKMPAYPPLPEGVTEKTPDGKALPWNVELVWALEAGGPGEAGLLWCGTIPGGLFRSADRGGSWEMIRSLWDHPLRKKWFGGGADYPGIHSICVHPKDSRRVTLGVSCGGVWVTEDGGATWNIRGKGMRAEFLPPEQAFDMDQQDPHRLVQCPARPDTLWVQHHNGIFHSSDAGHNWREITDAKPSNFGFAVAVHPKDPDTAWFVPAQKDEHRLPVGGQVVVSRTRDAGKSFEVLRKGLPQEQAYDIAFRHALDVDETGDRLAFGSTTGSLWVSEDQGDSWRTVSEHLPPVYCVRFEKNA